MKKVSWNIPDKQYNFILAMAREGEVSQSEIARRIIRYYLKNNFVSPDIKKRLDEYK